MMFMLHSDCQKQMMSIINVMLVSEQKMSIIILQKNSIKTKNIHEKLNKLRVLYELNERRNNELMLWRKMRRLTKMIEKLTRQRVTVLTVNWCMKNQLKRLKKIMNKLDFFYFFIKCMQSMTMTLSRRCVYAKLHVI